MIEIAISYGTPLATHVIAMMAAFVVGIAVGLRLIPRSAEENARIARDHGVEP